MDFVCRIEQEHLVVDGKGELGSGGLRRLFNLIQDRAKRSGHCRVVLNAGLLTSLDAVSVGALLLLAQRLSEMGGYLRLAALHSGISPLYEQLSLHEQLPHYNSLEQALNN